MIRPNNFYINEPVYKYITYSFKEGISDIMKIIAIVSILALINMIISLIIGIRKKDCIAILTGNIMVKTIVAVLYQVLDKLLYFTDNVFFVILLFIVTIIIEGLIYKKVLKYNKYSGLKVSLICNIGSVIVYFLISHII